MLKRFRKLVFRAGREDRGFSLVELMVVVAIIGALVAIGIPAFKDVQKSAKDNACAANVRQINGALAFHYADGNSAVADWEAASAAVKSYFAADAVPVCPYNKAYTVAAGYIEPHTDGDHTTP